jgi:hypothetical protein
MAAEVLVRPAAQGDAQVISDFNVAMAMVSNPVAPRVVA